MLRIGLGLFVLAVSAMVIILSIMSGDSLNLHAAIFAIILGTLSVIRGFMRKIALINIIYQGGQLSMYNRSASETIIFVTCLNKAKMGEFNCTKGL